MLALKANQGNFQEDVVQVFDHARCIDADRQHDFWQSLDSDHGRSAIPRYGVLGQVDYLVDAYQWVGLARIGLVESQRCLNGKTTIEQR